MNAIFKMFFYLFGWKIAGRIPYEVKKGVFAVCPHNTWKDFFLGIGVRAALKLNIGYFGKEELFKPPFGFIFRWLGGTPTVRNKNTNLVASHVEAINKAEDKLFALAPEGTRKNVSKLKTGFYYMAHGAGIPIIMVGFDFESKEVKLAEPFYPSGDYKEDMKKYFVPFFENIGGFQKDWIKNYKNNIFE
ncbi:glycerol acyltransferase [Emticicia sp. CRIBPO]|nr:glycerol acyltransferase [Emticicia sp. CRIBPO]